MPTKAMTFEMIQRDTAPTLVGGVNPTGQAELALASQGSLQSHSRNPDESPIKYASWTSSLTVDDFPAINLHWGFPSHVTTGSPRVASCPKHRIYASHRRFADLEATASRAVSMCSPGPGPGCPSWLLKHVRHVKTC